jgi:hypothetical protein
MTVAYQSMEKRQVPRVLGLNIYGTGLLFVALFDRGVPLESLISEATMLPIWPTTSV